MQWKDHLRDSFTGKNQSKMTSVNSHTHNCGCTNKALVFHWSIGHWTHNHTEHGFPARVSLCCLCLALKKFQVAGFALQVWFEPSIVTGSFSNWGRNAFRLLVPNGGSPPVNTRGWASVQEQQFLNWSRHWCLLSFSEADVCLLPLNSTTTPSTAHHYNERWMGVFISTSAYTKCWRKKMQLNGCFCAWYFFITSPNDPLTICYYCGSCLETNRTDREDLFPSHPVQGLLNC